MDFLLEFWVQIITISASPAPPAVVPSCGSLAQSVEQFAFNELVDGSNPSRPTIPSSSACDPDTIPVLWDKPELLVAV